jgi:putative hemolysin
MLENVLGSGPGDGAAVSYDIVPPISAGWLAEEIEELSPEQSLVESGPYTAYVATADQIPNVLYEIGRLREISFRLAGEGTGDNIDLSWFDYHYRHLFLWQRERQEIVAAYRIGATDTILPRYGLAGLYTSKLFTYEGELLDYLTPALELSRAFVRREYQREYSALFLLWRAIGRYVVENPRYKLLFGAVSISPSYRFVSRQLMLAYLRVNYFHDDLARFARAKNPPRAVPLPVWGSKKLSLFWKDIEELSAWIAAIEVDQKGAPILLRQYLRLGAKLLGFNEDKSFGSAWDGLIVLDLTRAEKKSLQRYMGRDGVESFFDYHRVCSPEAA